jgi:hypothetical protein
MSHRFMSTPPPDKWHVEGIGHLRERGEFWVLTYDGCGHECFFMRNPMNYELEAAWREVDGPNRSTAACRNCSRV